jgi:hypothetical protein
MGWSVGVGEGVLVGVGEGVCVLGGTGVYVCVEGVMGDGLEGNSLESWLQEVKLRPKIMLTRMTRCVFIRYPG